MALFIARDSFGGKVEGMPIEEHEWMVLFGLEGAMDIDVGVDIERDITTRLFSLFPRGGDHTPLSQFFKIL